MTISPAELEAVWNLAGWLERDGFPGYAAILRLFLTKLTGGPGVAQEARSGPGDTPANTPVGLAP